jgi:Ca-activated chloride channel family protein
MIALQQIEFLWPWAFYLAPLPLLLRWLLPAINEARQSALRIPFIDDFHQDNFANAHAAGQSGPLLIALLAWLLLITASARPLWVGDPIELPVSGRDLMMAVDLSGSMQEQDFLINNRPVDRLTVVKYIAGEFIERRVGDRIGLIVFADQAYVQTPLTFDRITVKILLDETFLGLAGERTAIGDAIGLAVKRLQAVGENERVLILLTDGASNSGELQPQQAAELAAKLNLKIYTIGIGADEVLRRSWLGSVRVNPSHEMDEKTLTAIANKTGGRYFRARNTQELQQIYALLDELEPVERETRSFRPSRSLFHWPLALAFVFAALLLINRYRRGQ